MKTLVIGVALLSAVAGVAVSRLSAADATPEWTCMRVGSAAVPAGEIPADRATTNLLEEMRQGAIDGGLAQAGADVQFLPGWEWICLRSQRRT